MKIQFLRSQNVTANIFYIVYKLEVAFCDIKTVKTYFSNNEHINQDVPDFLNFLFIYGKNLTTHIVN